MSRKRRLLFEDYMKSYTMRKGGMMMGVVVFM